MVGWIKLHRSLKDWEWYSDHNATRLLIHLLVSVNYEDKPWKNEIVKAGTMITSWENLSHETGLSVKQVRTAMSKLEKGREVGRQVAGNGASKWQVITLMKWDKLQDDGQINGQTKGSKSGKQRATTKEVKKQEVKKKEINTNPTNVELVFDTNLDFSGFNDSFLIGNLWKEWIDYKKLQHKDQYKTTKSEQTAINNLQKLCRGDTETARQIIEQSIANLYRGLFALKQQNNYQNLNNTQKHHEDQQLNSYALKHLRSIERSGNVHPRIIEGARNFLLQSTTIIDVLELAGTIDRMQAEMSSASEGHSGDTLRLGL